MVNQLKKLFGSSEGVEVAVATAADASTGVDTQVPKRY